MGAISSAAFAVRNTSKCVHGDTTRGAVAACQTVSTLDNIAGSASSIFSNAAEGVGNVLGCADKAVDTVFSKIGGEGGTEVLQNIKASSGAASEVGAIAQSAVNPLLCVAAGVRVLKDDDQYAALIEETTAMGAMFGCEALMKYARSSVTGSAAATKGLSGVVAKAFDKSNLTLLNTLKEKGSTWFKSLSGGKQTAAKIGIDILFVCGSILAYNIGHKIGTKLSHRDKDNS